MRKIVAAEEMRELDRLTTERYAVPSLLLMEAAANAAARAILSRFKVRHRSLRALILCGRGNNGGDGAALARVLWMAGVAQIEVALFGRTEDAQGDARTNFEIVRQLAAAVHFSTDTPTTRLSFVECASEESWEEVISRRVDYDIVIDALFGTGLTRPLGDIFKRVTAHLARLRERRRSEGTHPRPLIVSIDLPSGLNADLSHPFGPTVQADLTVTFTAPKPANVLPPAAHLGGELVIADIGTPRHLLEESPTQFFLTEAEDASGWLSRTRYAPGSYKYTHGHALVIAGSRRFTGAAVLSGNAAMCAGAGLVTVAAPASAVSPIASRLMPEVMTAALPETGSGAASEEAVDEIIRLAERAQVVAIGPGLSSAEEGPRRLVRALVEQRTTPVVIDADGLNALAPWPAELSGSSQRPLILTPHEGEMLRLLGDEKGKENLAGDRVGTTRKFAVKHQLILVLKGERTLIAAPDGRVFVNSTGNAGLGTAGSGDTLTGIITGFLAQAYGALKEQADPLTATIAAVYVGGLAGDMAADDKGMRSMTASDIREYLPAAIRSLDPLGEMPG
ncbi:MAG: NAD(P)H-hydrate dehydratase [Pyrinomonadaceae bacterium]